VRAGIFLSENVHIHLFLGSVSSLEIIEIIQKMIGEIIIAVQRLEVYFSSPVQNSVLPLLKRRDI